MRTHVLPTRSRRRGFALIEALIALLLIAVGLVAVSKLQTFSLFGSGDARMRTQAANIAQREVETLRNMISRGDLAILDAIKADVAVVPPTPADASTTFKVFRTITQPDGGLDQRLVQITVNWNNAQGVEQRLDLNTVLAWDNPSTQAAVANNAGGGGQMSKLVSPTGAAERPGGKVPSGLAEPVSNPDGTKIYKDSGSGMTWLADADGNIILSLPPKDGKPRDFTTISGRILFDPAVAGAATDSDEVKVRLSSEGECIYNSTPGSLLTAEDSANKSYKYFRYTCYVGPGWYGNVGLQLELLNNGNFKYNVCVGDKGYNGGQNSGVQTSADPRQVSVRTYRGFRETPGSGSGYQSTGVAAARKYGVPVKDRGVENPGPSGSELLNQDFLVTNIPNNKDCGDVMGSSSIFTGNAGQYVCINPHDHPDPSQCPTPWPGHSVSAGSATTYLLTVAKTGTGAVAGMVSGSGIACGSDCQEQIVQGTTVVLTAGDVGSSKFVQWIGCPTAPSGATCTVTMTAALTVTADFNMAGTDPTAYPLSLTVTGGGTVSSSAGGITGCSGTCSATIPAGTSVTLTRTEGTGTFEGWGGACASAGISSTCIVEMTESRNVSAAFTIPSPPNCTTEVTGGIKHQNDQVTATPGGACGNDKSAGSYTCKNINVPKDTQIELRYVPKQGNEQPTTVTVKANCLTVRHNFN